MSMCEKTSQKHGPATDLTRWRLKVDDGRQVWHYLETDSELEAWPQTNADKYFIGLPFEKPKFERPKTAREAAENAFEFLKLIQTEEGFWSCEYGGPLFLLPGLCISHYITGFELKKPVKKEIIRYLCNFVNADGGWGLHIEHHSTMYGTVMNYVSLRILGLEADNPIMVRARELIQTRGGATSIPSWGKLLLACMNLYDYEGMHPIPPELWCLPDWSPFHPGNLWVHSRNVYTPMSYLYGVKFSCEVNTFIRSLRQEIYCEDYDVIDWPASRSEVHEIDLYTPHTTLMETLNVGLGFYEKIVNYFPYAREMGLREALNQIRMEDENTKYLDVGPVNQVLNLLCVYHADGENSEAFNLHVGRLPDFLFLGEDGMMMNGTNGVQLWDTAFIVQAVMEADIAARPGNKEALIKAHKFLDSCQIKDNSLHFGKDYRHPSKGAWPFSTRDQSYTVSDCTAEGLKAVLYLQALDFTQELVSDERLFDAVDILLSIQNSSGGSASYELVRGGAYYEYFNVSEVFGNIMIEYCYPECTTAVLLGLTTFRKFYPDYRAEDIKTAQQKAVDYIKSIQREDGSWYGSWGICFTYATFFAIESLSTFGEFYHNSSNVRQACEFLVSKQRDDGGWGETYKSCEEGVYNQASTSQVVNTSWAVLSLLAAKYPNQEIISRGVKLIVDCQLPSGEWRQELIEGVFNKNCMISYPNYKLYFTMWALGRYAKIYSNPCLE
ncbi:Lanosterol synthase (Oxidosqualene--lanosterol cyclase) [Entomophthora muscae]|uniref:Lanosterol synthase (Oxidosqualene--lanosterol cyclase) n=2 Tax=Entomophthora muscae TaxID=34485 RepID=A0ACC2UQ69_9FUNG|nr:Lanosterol synthase (Oxidosqualene--lanosterol cyclase) [Entomophthora muscae]